MGTAATKSRDKRRSRKNVPVRLSDEAIKWSRIASGYTGESMADYVSRITIENSITDIDRLHAEVVASRNAPATDS